MGSLVVRHLAAVDLSSTRHTIKLYAHYRVLWVVRVQVYVSDMASSALPTQIAR